MKILYVLVGLCAILGLSSGQDCGEGYFTCDNGRCIWDDWVCDGDNDCGDFSDEPDTCPPCPSNYWECANGNCVSITYICDGDNDCGDMSDELDPETGTCPLCPDSHFQCLNGRCVTKSSVCNGVDNCRDNSDEPDDPSQCPECSDGQYRCSNGKCINGAYVCDADNDCGDWSDETEDACPCADDEIRCSVPPSEGPTPPGACVPPEYICDEDGIWDCPQGDDEANCTVRAGKINHNKKAHHLGNKKINHRQIKLATQRKEKVNLDKAQSAKKIQLWKRIFKTRVSKKTHV